ncbi:hypothetical protein F383_00675 [Gossypium arboreum]|uniref:Uncharacterized protein n=1 Tax=Gossypium arboreum TaxID=29729 RepID=A0A0B0PN79_GOSAR|nr:hypothetical protein F383_15211 [Gossypium arboreum]KHG29883.1 hypothetical protein F383_00675 [Gossypium arboreum]
MRRSSPGNRVNARVLGGRSALFIKPPRSDPRAITDSATHDGRNLKSFAFQGDSQDLRKAL